MADHDVVKGVLESPLILLGKSRNSCVTENRFQSNTWVIVDHTETGSVKRCSLEENTSGLPDNILSKSTCNADLERDLVEIQSDNNERVVGKDDNEQYKNNGDRIIDLNSISIYIEELDVSNCDPNPTVLIPKENKQNYSSLTFDVNLKNFTGTQSAPSINMPKKPKNSLQEAFLHFRKKRQDDIRQERRRRDAILRANADPARMDALRARVIEQARKYFGVPYARKYWSPETPEYSSPLFLDCCGLVRQIIRDLKDELGFRLGPWNQAYMFDTLPVTLKKSQMKPGDLVFMRGVYVNPKSKKQPHNMTHVEIWLGDGDKTIGSRWNNGKVQEFDSYKFNPKSFHSEEYIFKSIDTWLMGICHSYCSKHTWRMAKYNPTTKSIFHTQQQAEEVIEDEKANADSDENENVDDDKDNSKSNNSNESDNSMSRETLSDNAKFEHGHKISAKEGDEFATPRNQLMDQSQAGRTSGTPKKSLSTPRQGKVSARTKTTSPFKNVKAAQSTFELDTSVLNDGSTIKIQSKKKGTSTIKPATAAEVGKMASHVLKRKTKPVPKDSAEKIDYRRSASIPQVRSYNNEELHYIPAHLPGRSNVIYTQWMTSKEREKKVRKERDDGVLQGNQKVPSWSLHQSERNPRFSIVGSQDLLLTKTRSCPNFQSPPSALRVRGDTTLTDLDHRSKGAGKSMTVNRQASLNLEETRTANTDSGILSRDSSASISIHGTISRPSGTFNPLENCLIVRKSPSLNEKRNIRKVEKKEKSVPPSPSVQILRQIRQKHVRVEQRPDQRPGGAFSLIREEASSVGVGEESQVVFSSAAQVRSQKIAAASIIQDAQNKEVAFKARAAEIDDERSAYFKDEKNFKDIGDLKPMEIDLASLNFSEEVVLESARVTFEEDKADDLNTSFCSDMSPDDCINRKEPGDNNDLMTFYDSDTDEELNAAMNLNIINHRCLSGDGLRTLQTMSDSNLNPSWEWLHNMSSDIKEAFLNTNNNSSNECGGSKSEHDGINYDETDYISELGEGDIGLDSRVESEKTFIRHKVLPPLSSLGQPEIPESNLQNQDNNHATGKSKQRGNDNTHFDQHTESSFHMGLPTRQGNRIASDSSLREGDPVIAQNDVTDLLAKYIINQHPRGSDDIASSVNARATYDNLSNQRSDSSMADSSAVGVHSISSDDWMAFPLQEKGGESEDDDWLETRTRSFAISNSIRLDEVSAYISHSSSESEMCNLKPGHEEYKVKEWEKSRREHCCKIDTFNKLLSIPDEIGFQAEGDKSATMGLYWDIQSSLLKLDGQKQQAAKKGTGDEKAGGEGEGKGRDQDKPTDKGGSGDHDVGGKGKDGGGGTGSGQTGGGGGGGNKKPQGSRPSKLPQCTLPNNMQPTFYIGGGNGTALVEGPLLALGWKRISDKFDERFRLKWVECKSKINYTAFREGEQLVNHIPNCKLLTNKMGLLCSLQEYERVTLLTKGRPPRLKMADFVPETYKLDEKNDREKYLNEYKDGEVWICKPTGMNQGKGIFLLRSREEIDQLLVERDAKNQARMGSRPPMMRIVQRYIHNPLLLDGRKFDIRAYMLIASTVPYLLLYHKGYVRLSCMKYDNDDTNLTTHLTNQYVQKKDPAYKDVKEDTAWTMDKFNDYINEHVAKTKDIEQDWVYGALTKQMQRIILHCFNSVKHKLQCKIGYFDLYGMDFMVDSDMKVWLIEINVNPALHTNCEALKEAIPCVVEETIALSIECFDKSRKSQPLMPLNSLRGFNVLYCGSSPTAVAPRQTRSVSPSKDGTEKTRPSGTAPAARRTSPPRNLPRMSSNTTQMTTGQATATTTVVTQAPANKKPVASSTLPTINIGATIIQKQPTGTSNSKQSPYQAPPFQMQQESTSISNEEHKFKMTHGDPGSRRNRDYSNRGN